MIKEMKKMTKCDVKECGKEMIKMPSTRTDGNLYENLGTGRAYLICTECEDKLLVVKKVK